MLRTVLALALTVAPICATPVLADSPEVVGAKATPSGGDWRFDVTVRHADTGWDHYADGWKVTLEDGTELGYRKLLHPHETEQPFTRSLGGVDIPEGTARVLIVAHDSVHGWGAPFQLDLE